MPSLDLVAVAGLLFQAILLGSVLVLGVITVKGLLYGGNNEEES